MKHIVWSMLFFFGIGIQAQDIPKYLPGRLHYDGDLILEGVRFKIARSLESKHIAVMAERHPHIDYDIQEERDSKWGIAGKHYLIHVSCTLPGLIGMPNPENMIGRYISELDNSTCYVFPWSNE